MFTKTLTIFSLFIASSAFAQPFQPGERLTYSVQWHYGPMLITAGHLTSTIQTPVTDAGGNVVYPIVAFAKSSGIVNTFYPFHYTIRSWWDQNGFSRRFEMHGAEKDDRKDQVEVYDYTTHQSSLHQVTNHTVNRRYSLANNTQDILSVLYFFRTANLPRPGQNGRFPIAYEGAPWHVLVKNLGREEVKFDGRKIPADVFQLDFYAGSRLDNAGTKMWVSADSRRLVLKLNSKVKVGKIWVKLDSVQ